MKKITVLESLRGFASLYVAVGHFVLSFQHTPHYLSLLFRFGQEAVIIFFILSGFVIFYSSIKNENENLKSYFVKRFRRIYFPLICALIVSIVFVNTNFSLKTLVGNLLMLQDFETGKPGNIVNPFLGNAPLWSLSYEWTFYMLFPFIFPVLANNPNRIHFIGAFSVINLIIFIIFPNHMFLVFAYFLIWWTGLELGEFFIGIAEKAKIKTLLCYYGFIILILTITSLLHFRVEHSIKLGIYPYLVLRHFCFAAACLIMCVYLTSVTRKITGLIKHFAFIAPVSYGIYILHYPILVQSHFHLALPYELAFKVLLIGALSYLIEIVLQPKINKLLR